MVGFGVIRTGHRNRVTRRRYLNYRRARTWLDGVEEEVAGPELVQQFRELAEDLLLSRGAPAEVASLDAQIEPTLRRLADLRLITPPLTWELDEALRAAGPNAGTRANPPKAGQATRVAWVSP